MAHKRHSRPASRAGRYAPDGESAATTTRTELANGTTQRPKGPFETSAMSRTRLSGQPPRPWQRAKPANDACGALSTPCASFGATARIHSWLNAVNGTLKSLNDVVG